MGEEEAGRGIGGQMGRGKHRQGTGNGENTGESAKKKGTEAKKKTGDKIQLHHTLKDAEKSKGTGVFLSTPGEGSTDLLEKGAG